MAMGAWASRQPEQEAERSRVQSHTENRAGEPEVGQGHKPSQRAVSSRGKQLWRRRISPFPVSLLRDLKHYNQYPYSQVLSVEGLDQRERLFQGLTNKLCPSQDPVLTFISTA